MVLKRRRPLYIYIAKYNLCAFIFSIILIFISEEAALLVHHLIHVPCCIEGKKSHLTKVARMGEVFKI